MQIKKNFAEKLCFSCANSHFEKTCVEASHVFEPKFEHEIRFVNVRFYGGVAQLGEHLPCKQGVMSSNLTISTQQLGCWNLHIDNCILTENCLNRQKTIQTVD